MRSGLVLVLLFLLGLLAFLIVRERRGGSPPAAPAEPARISAAESEALLAERTAPASSEPREPVPSASTNPDPGGDGPAADRVLFGARLIDEHGEPLALAHLSWVVPAESGLFQERASAAADRSGAVWLAVERKDLPREDPLQLAATAPGRMQVVLRVDPAKWNGMAQVNLGEVTLVRAR